MSQSSKPSSATSAGKSETKQENNNAEIAKECGKNDTDAPEVDKDALKEQFESYGKFGDKAADGKTIKLSQSDKWFKQAKVIDGKNITTTDTGIAFRKISK